MTASPTREFGIAGATQKDCEMRIAKTDCEKTGHHFSFSQFAFRLSQFLYWWLPKTGQAQGPAPTKDLSIPNS
jgi:hypothetical protein